MTTATPTTPDQAPAFTRAAVERLSRARQEPVWLREQRLAAFELFQRTPLPTTLQRAWKYTDVSRLQFDAFTGSAPASDDHASYSLSEPAVAETGGVLRQHDLTPAGATLSDEARAAGVVLCSIEEAVRDHADLVQAHFMTECVPASWDKFTALHAAFWTGGAFVYVPRNVTVHLPLYSLLSATTDQLAVFPHALVIAEPGSDVTLVEEFGSPDLPNGLLSLGVTEIFVRQNARVRYINLQRWGSTAQHFGVQRALLDRDAQLNFATIGLGGRLSKATGESVMRGQGSNSELLGLFYGSKRQQFDYVTLQDHQAPNTSSDLLFKAALNDRARAIYYGLVRVGPEAKQANANQENRNLLLSNRARADSDPVLEILTSEVTRCTHGASVGPVDEEQLFYLQSRGIDHDEAERLLVHGFFHQVIGRIPIPEVRARLEAAVDERVLI